MKFSEFISELKHRHVFKATVAYAAIAWVIIQIASTVFPAFNAPDYALKVLFYVLGIGFIFWIVFSWTYDITPEGIQKTDLSLEDEEAAKLTDRRLNKVIVGSLVLAVLLLVVISFWAGSSWNDDPELIGKKVAVLPFIQNTENEEEDYFRYGMTDGIIDELSKIDQLTVISKSSTQIFTSGFASVGSLMNSVISGIDYYVYGDIYRNNNSIIFQIEIRETLEGNPIWKKEYSFDLSEIRILMAEVSHDLARQMSVAVKPEV